MLRKGTLCVGRLTEPNGQRQVVAEPRVLDQVGRGCDKRTTHVALRRIWRGRWLRRGATSCVIEQSACECAAHQQRQRGDDYRDIGRQGPTAPALRGPGRDRDLRDRAL